MAQYRVLEKSYIVDRICEEGEVVEYGGVPGSNLEPVDADAKKAVEAAAKSAKPAPSDVNTSL